MNVADARIVWGVLWRTTTALGGRDTYIINGKDCLPMLFLTQRKAREFIVREYGYIKTRRDLRSEPHGWRMPIPVRVKVCVLTVAGRRGRA